MLARFKSWWSRRSSTERVLLAAGVPLTAVAALWNRHRTVQAQAAQSESGPGSQAVTPGEPAAAQINAAAVGVDSGQLAQFSESFNKEISQLESRVSTIESGRGSFGQNPSGSGPADGYADPMGTIGGPAADGAKLTACVANLTQNYAAQIQAATGASLSTIKAIARAACEASGGDPAKALAAIRGG